MADENVELEIEFDPIFGPRAKKKLVDDSEKLGKKVGDNLADGTTSGFKSVTGGISSILNTDIGNLFKNFAKRTAQVLAVAAVAIPVVLTKRAVEISKTLQNSVLGLSSVAGAFGQNVGAVTQKARELASDGLIPLEDVSSSLKNLLVNFNGDLEKSVEVFDALKNSAAFNRQGQLSLGEAIRGASEGLKNDLSIKIDNAGVTKNLSILQKEYAKSIGTSVGKLTEAQKVQAEYVGIIKEASIFQGDYNKLLSTYSGATGAASTANRFLLGTLGDIVTKSPSVIALIKENARTTRELTKDLKGLEGSDPLKTIIISLIDFGQTLNNFVIRPVVALKRVFEIVFQGAVTGVNGLVAGIGKLGGALGKVVGFFSKESALTQGLKDFAETSEIVFSESGDELKKLTDGLFDPVEVANKGDSFLESLRAVVTNAKDVVVAGNSEIIASNTDVKSSFQQLQDFLGLNFQFFSEASGMIATNWKAVTDSIKKNAILGVGKGVGSAFSAFGAALVNGENALKAFGKAFLASIGQAAVALGTRFILEGVAISFNPFLGGPAVGGPLIGAGAALATFGGALGAIGGGGGGTATGGGVGASSFSGSEIDSEPALAEVEELRAPDTQVSVVIQGDVFDSDETGTRLVQVLNSAFDKDGVVINGGAVA